MAIIIRAGYIAEVYTHSDTQAHEIPRVISWFPSIRRITIATIFFGIFYAVATLITEITTIFEFDVDRLCLCDASINGRHFRFAQNINIFDVILRTPIRIYICTMLQTINIDDEEKC